MIAGFWIRLVSDVLDAILLGVFGFCIALPIRGSLYQLGENGVWIGLCITFLYAGILQSGIGQGQSLAKRLLKIEVRRMDGSYLSLGASFFRYSVIALLFYNAWIELAIEAAFPSLNNPVVQTAYTAILMLIFAGTILLVPFHPLKRGIHDLISGSVVVHKGRFDAEALRALDNPRRAWIAYTIAGVVAGALVIVMVMLGNGLIAPDRIAMLLRAQDRITHQTNLENVSVQERWFRRFGSTDGATTTLVANGFLTKAVYDDEGRRAVEAQKAADVLLDAYGRGATFDGINITVRTGYDIGIFNSWESWQYAFDHDGTLIRNR